ncbi:MAG: class I SAM-dependent methyltransferase [Lysobacter sp.]|nr:class I SAM-dependent methyltransferase [Lysobacter sp.]
MPSNLDFHVLDGTSLPFADESMDLIYSWSVFEHIRMDLFPTILQDLRRVLKKDGHLFVQVDPLYFSPRGAHLYGIIDEPWVHLLDQHDVLVDRVMARGKHASAIRQYETLNRITEPELAEKITSAGFRLLRRHRTDCGLTPPERLLRIYQPEVLTTNTVYMLACKEQAAEKGPS